MVNSPQIWDIAEDIVIDLFLANPSTGAGLTGQVPFITLTIQKKSDSRYWNGSTWLPGFTTTTMSEVDDVTEPGHYRAILPGVLGNFEADVYYVHANVNNAPTIEGDDYSVHTSRDLTKDIKVYESEPELIIRSD